MRKLLRVLKWAVLGCFFLVALLFLFPRHAVYLSDIVSGIFSRPAPPAFSGDSQELEHTAVLPTLDTPVPPNKNLVWCSTMQVAWNKLKNDIVKEPILVANAQEVADRLNKSESVAEDAPDGTWFAAAGYVDDGVVEEIRREMGRFPELELPEVQETDILVAFAALDVNAPFRHHYVNYNYALKFKSSDGTVAQVRSFGVPEDLPERHRPLLSQVKVWYNSGCYQKAEPAEFVLDLRDNGDVRVIVARLPLMNTLAETVNEVAAIVNEDDPRHEEVIKRRLTEHIKARVQDVSERASEFEAIPSYAKPRELRENDLLMVPETSWQIMHHFRELEGPDKRLLNDKLKERPQYIRAAMQKIDFTLERTGAHVRSWAFMATEKAAEPASQRYVLDGPFMIMMKKRECPRPFFVIWVDNAELLSPF